MNFAVEFAKHFAWLFLRCVFVFLRNVIWKFNGVSQHLRDIRTKQFYQNSTHVRKILLKFNMDPIELPSSERWFITTHESFENPEYVLKRNVTLFYVNDEEATFVESDPADDAMNSDNGGFLRVAQNKVAKKFIIMPLRCFHKVAESLPDVENKIVFLSNTARCGSTLLTQVFEETGRCVAWAEPDALNAITQLGGKISEEEIDYVARSTVKILCKPIGRPVDAYILKVMSPSMMALPRLHRLYPQAKHLFMYRDGLPNIKSFNQFSHLMPILDALLRTGKYSSLLTAYFMRMMGLPDDMFKEKLESRSHFSALVWGSGVRLYLDFREQGLPIYAVKYEDIIESTATAFQEIFRFLKIPFDESVTSAIQTAFGRDSQRGTPVSRVAVSRVHPEVIDERIMKNINNVCKQFGLPPVTEFLIVPGTITHVS